MFIVELMLTLILADGKEKSGSDAVLSDDEKAIKVDEIRQSIISQCQNSQWKGGLKWKDEKTISSDAISNVFLFLCKPDYYLPIPAQDKKSLINKNLSDLINNDALPSEEDEVVKNMCEIDRNLYKIRKKIREIYGKLADEQQPVDTGLKDTFSKIAGMLNPFWQPNIRPFWENTTQDLKRNELSDEVLLEYKKAMVLYGPPGTSKSYQARRMAENLN